MKGRTNAERSVAALRMFGLLSAATDLSDLICGSAP